MGAFAAKHASTSLSMITAAWGELACRVGKSALEKRRFCYFLRSKSKERKNQYLLDFARFIKKKQ